MNFPAIPHGTLLGRIPSGIIFDLDGTLVDTIEDIAYSMNNALADLGISPCSVDDYRRYIGQGLETLVQQVLPEGMRDTATIERCVAGMRREYTQHWARASRPYDGIPELISALNQRNIRLSVLSNKRHDFTRKIVERFFGIDKFEMVIGVGELPAKPDPTGAMHIAQTMAVAPNEFLYIGDSEVDMETALNAGMYPLGVTWGFRTPEQLLASGAKQLVQIPKEILEIINCR